eukprot:scaffold910_cov396-Prasinococcus_capsulatus_cf.AAC.64
MMTAVSTGIQSLPEGTSGRVELEALYIPFDAPEDFDLPVDCFSLPPPGVVGVVNPPSTCTSLPFEAADPEG